MRMQCFKTKIIFFINELEHLFKDSGMNSFLLFSLNKRHRLFDYAVGGKSTRPALSALERQAELTETDCGSTDRKTDRQSSSKVEWVTLGFPGHHQDFVTLRTSRQAGSSTGIICGRQKAGTLVKTGSFRKELGAGG